VGQMQQGKSNTKSTAAAIATTSFVLRRGGAGCGDSYGFGSIHKILTARESTTYHSPLLQLLKQLPDVKFEQAIKRTDGTYEVRGRDKAGRVRDVELSATGEVIAVE